MMGRRRASGWKDRKEGFSHFLNVLGQAEGVRKGLNDVYLNKSGVREEVVRQIMQEVGFERAKLWNR